MPDPANIIEGTTLPVAEALRCAEQLLAESIGALPETPKLPNSPAARLIAAAGQNPWV